MEPSTLPHLFAPPFWPAPFWPVFGGLAGLIAGSFLATLVLRWPRGDSLGGRSRCDNCRAQLSVAELLPLLSFLLARGRCRHCGTRIDWRHPAIELTATLIGALALFAVPGPAGFAGALLGWILLALLALDTEHLWLPDALTMPLLALGLLLGPGTIGERLLGAAIGGGGLLAIALGYRALRGREGLGLGDVKLMAALGAWLSPVLIPPLILVAALAGLVLAAGKALGKHKEKEHKQEAPLEPEPGAEPGRPMQIPFGACLAAAGFPMWLAANGLGLG
ncbi:MAG: prepilin peptidase [Sandarakinorhabdus sp.]|nr:prepilin peptidase [Sandarakinorhabdus sp.]